jgi:hypothetical protein
MLPSWSYTMLFYLPTGKDARKNYSYKWIPIIGIGLNHVSTIKSMGKIYQVNLNCLWNLKSPPQPLTRPLGPPSIITLDPSLEESLH